MYLVDGEILLDYSFEVNSKEIGATNQDQVGMMTEDLICECGELYEIPIITRSGILKIKVHKIVEAIAKNVQKIDSEGYLIEKEKTSNSCDLLDDVV